ELPIGRGVRLPLPVEASVEVGSTVVDAAAARSAAAGQHADNAAALVPQARARRALLGRALAPAADLPGGDARTAGLDLHVGRLQWNRELADLLGVTRRMVNADAAVAAAAAGVPAGVVDVEGRARLFVEFDQRQVGIAVVG